jgi:hypothetical protein
MKAILFFIAFAIYTFANAQNKTVNLAETDTTSIYLVKLLDNTNLTGKILEKGTEVIVFNDVTLGKITLMINKIVSVTKISGNQHAILTTTDGKTLTGMIISQDEKEMRFKTESIGEINIANGKIKDLKLIEKEQMVGGKYYFPNPHPTRYFFGPSAIPLKRGEGYFQNAWILSNSVQRGMTDNFSLGGGIVIPVLFFITPKWGYKVAKNVHVGGGILFASTLSSEMSFGIGVGYGSVTLGSEENNFTMSLGWGAMKLEDETYNSSTQTYSSTSKWEMAKKPIITFSAMARIAPRLSLVTENWIFATKDNEYNSYNSTYTYTHKYHSVLSGGFRFLGERHSFDFGLAMPITKEATIGIPYLDYVFKF